MIAREDSQLAINLERLWPSDETSQIKQVAYYRPNEHYITAA